MPGDPGVAQIDLGAFTLIDFHRKALDLRRQLPRHRINILLFVDLDQYRRLVLPIDFAGDDFAGVDLAGANFTNAGSLQIGAGDKLYLNTYTQDSSGSLTVVKQPAEANLSAWGTPPDSLPLMREIKHSFDPERILNPGRFLGGI